MGISISVILLFLRPGLLGRLRIRIRIRIATIGIIGAVVADDFN